MSSVSVVSMGGRTVVVVDGKTVYESGLCSPDCRCWWARLLRWFT
jgi:hypothetical protein